MEILFDIADSMAEIVLENNIMLHDDISNPVLSQVWELPFYEIISQTILL